MKRTTCSPRRFRNTRFEHLEIRNVLNGDLPDVFVDFDILLGMPAEGSQASPTDPVAEWGLFVQLTDTEGGTFDLAVDLDGDGNFGLVDGEPEKLGVTIGPGGFHDWNLSIGWQTMIAAGFGDTHGVLSEHNIFARATDVGPLGPGETVPDVASKEWMIDLPNSMPFFGTVTPSQAPSVAGGCGGGIAPVTLSGTFTEYGMNDTVTLRINWGDSIETLPGVMINNQSGVPFSIQHTYTTAGLKNISWQIWDDEGTQDALPFNPASSGSVPGGFMVVGGAPAGPSVCLDGGVLTVTGSSGNDSAMITQPNGVIRVESSFFPTAEFPAANVQNIVALSAPATTCWWSTPTSRWLRSAATGRTSSTAAARGAS